MNKIKKNTKYWLEVSGKILSVTTVKKAQEAYDMWYCRDDQENSCKYSAHELRPTELYAVRDAILYHAACTSYLTVRMEELLDDLK